MRVALGLVAGMFIVVACTGDAPVSGVTNNNDAGSSGTSSGTSGTPGTDSGPTVDAPGIQCDPGKTLCGASCVDLSTDSAHCGACGAGCNADVRCYGGTCDGHKIEDFSLGSRSGCALLKSGQVWCWGVNQYGALGVGPENDEQCVTDIAATVPCRTQAVQVTNLNDAIAVSVGSDHACAVRKDGTVVCWGSNANSKLGLGSQETEQCGTVACSRTPKPVPNVSGMKNVMAGQLHTCAWGDGSAMCWGSNDQWRLGGTDGITGDRPPTPVAQIPSFKRIGAPDDYSTLVCARDGADKAWCWGNNATGGVGRSDANCQAAACGPGLVAGLGTVRDVAASDAAGCAVMSDGKVMCWGNDVFGIATSSGGPAHQPRDRGLSEILEIDIGQLHACARSASGLWCWGMNGMGQVGDGTGSGPDTCFTGGRCYRATTFPVPNVVPEKVRVGRDMTMVLRNNKLVGWGVSSDGRLGRKPGTDGACPAEPKLRCGTLPGSDVVGLP